MQMSCLILQKEDIPYIDINFKLEDSNGTLIEPRDAEKLISQLKIKTRAEFYSNYSILLDGQESGGLKGSTSKK